jgi:hypothetical protein
MSANATCGHVNAPGAWSAPGRRLRLEKPHEPSTSGDPPGDFRERRGPKPTLNIHDTSAGAARCYPAPGLRPALLLDCSV